MSGPEALDPALVAILVCPVSRTPLRYDPAAGELVADAAGLAYPVRSGVPVLLAEAARQRPAVSPRDIGAAVMDPER